MIPLRWLIVGTLALIVFVVGYTLANQFPPPTIRVMPPLSEALQTRTPTPEERQVQVVALTTEAEGEPVVFLPVSAITPSPRPVVSPHATVTKPATASPILEASPTTTVASPTATVTVAVPLPPSDTPQILRFELDTSSVAWDGTVTATWETKGYDTIFLTINSFESQIGMPLPYPDTYTEGLPASGSQTFNISDILAGKCAASSLEWHFTANETLTGVYDHAEGHTDVDLSGYPVTLDSFTMSPNPVASNAVTTIAYAGRGGQQLTVVGDSTINTAPDWENAAKYWATLHMEGESGNYAYQLPNRHTLETDYWVIYGQPGGATICTTYTLAMTCPYTYWIDEPQERTAESCPTGEKVTIPASYQRFEHGVMLWDSDLKLIHVLYDDGTNAYYNDYWDGQPVSYPSEPPAGTIAPSQGFGYVWTNNSDISSRLGWATEPEQPYSMTRQWVKNGYGNFYAGYSIIGPMYMTLPDGKIVRSTLEAMSGGRGWVVLP